MDVIFGLIPVTLYELISLTTKNRLETDKILENSMEKFKEYLQKNIWVRRCNEVKQWEIENGIKNNKQKHKVLVTPTNSVTGRMVKNRLIFWRKSAKNWLKIGRPILVSSG